MPPKRVIGKNLKTRVSASATSSSVNNKKGRKKKGIDANEPMDIQDSKFFDLLMDDDLSEEEANNMEFDYKAYGLNKYDEANLNSDFSTTNNQEEENFEQTEIIDKKKRKKPSTNNDNNEENEQNNNEEEEEGFNQKIKNKKHLLKLLKRRNKEKEEEKQEQTKKQTKKQKKLPKQEDGWTEEDFIEDEDEGTTKTPWKKVKLDEEAFSCEGLLSLEVLDDPNDTTYQEIMSKLYPSSSEGNQDNKKESSTIKEQEEKKNNEEEGEGESKKKKKKKKKNKKKKEENVVEASSSSSSKQDNEQFKEEEKMDDSDEEEKATNETKEDDEEKKKKKKKKKQQKEKKVNMLETVNEDFATISLENLHERMKGWIHMNEEDNNATTHIHPLLLRNLYRLGFYTPTEIQLKTLPTSLKEKVDVLAAAETGSGKTLAYTLPILDEILKSKENGEDNELKERLNSLSKKVLKSNEITLDEIHMKKVDKYIHNSLNSLRAIIIAPTRELAVQVSKHIEALLINTSLHIATIVGGISEEKQIRVLNTKSPEIIVATPGRFWKYLSGGLLGKADYLCGLMNLVIDEADKMIMDGSYTELQSILRYITVERTKRVVNSKFVLPYLRKFISSATLTFIDGKWKKQLLEVAEKEQERLKKSSSTNEDTTSIVEQETKEEEENTTSAMEVDTTNEEEEKERRESKEEERQKKKTNILVQKILAILNMTEPFFVDLTENKVAHTLKECYLECTKEEKILFLYYFLTMFSGRTIVFTNSVKQVKFISHVFKVLKLNNENCYIAPLHGKMDQKVRLKNFDKIQKHENCILVTTDVSARGLDIKNVENVVHMNLPPNNTSKTYIHRCGRSGRAGREGFSLTLLSPDERKLYYRILEDTNRTEEGLPTFPMNQPELLDSLRKRMNLALKITKLETRNDKCSANKSWYAKQAEALGIGLDERFIKEKGAKGLTDQQFKELDRLKRELDGMLYQNLFTTKGKRFIAGNPDSLEILRSRTTQTRQQKALSTLENSKRK